MRPALSVIIPTRNRVATLGRTLEAWRGHESGAPFEVVVVDDGSEDRTFEALTAAAAKDPRLRCLHQDGSGPAAARNRALASSTGEIVLFTGDDIRPGAGLVEGHVAAHAAKEAARFILGRTEWDDERPVTPVMRHITGFGGQQFRYAYLRDGLRLGFKYFYGSNLSVARQTLGATSGPFDASFRGAALEDADLGYRLMNRRQEIGYKADLLAFHDHPYDVAGFAARQRRVGLATAGFGRKASRSGGGVRMGPRDIRDRGGGPHPSRQGGRACARRHRGRGAPSARSPQPTFGAWIGALGAALSGTLLVLPGPGDRRGTGGGAGSSGSLVGTPP
jgi:glycosyltransferase involved in cell wall biosynthesis